MSLAENFQLVKPRQEALALFLFGNAQMEFQHQRAVAGEMTFKGANILETMFPDVLFGHARRQLLPFEEIGMDRAALRLMPAITCLMTPSLPAASMPWSTISTDQRA